MEDTAIKIDEFYILAKGSRGEDRTRVLKHGETFAIFDRYGDIHAGELGEQGIFHEGTRYLSRLELQLDRNRPMLFLSSTIQKANELLAVDLMNPDIFMGGEVLIPRGVLHIFRSSFLLEGVCYERLRISNFGLMAVDFPISFSFDADFSDIFEVRGTRRKQKGQRLEDSVEESRVILSYKGLDGKVRRTRLDCFPRPDEASSSEVRFQVSLQPKQESVILITVSCESQDNVSPRPLPYEKAFGEATESMRTARARACEITTSNEQFNDWLNRSLSDLCMMMTETVHGPYPYAGVPWFSTAFGRDGIITALQLLWVDSEVARGVLSFLAATQATELNSERDAEPGKILHETRKGEMAALGEIPFGQYYGSVDSTPLFVVLAGAYYERTGDRQLIESIWPNIELALKWMNEYGDADGDGFVEYARHSHQGLVHQGWKDSSDSVFHADGTHAQGPIALCEVQGYVYDAKCKAAKLASLLGHEERAEDLLHQAKRLKDQFEKAFWSEDMFTYVLALDGSKQPCRVRASNAGHCLFSGISSREHARSTAQTLMTDSFFSGWGIRTIATSEPRYNPMSYHNGTIWPHDNSLIAYGFSQYGLNHLADKILTGLFKAATFLDLHRLPELFCGFVRRPGQGPTLYPVACEPQAWASGSVFLLLQSCLGLSIDACNRQVRLTYPQLPPFLHYVQIKNIKVGDAFVDLLFKRHAEDVSVNVLRREGIVEIVVIK